MTGCNLYKKGKNARPCYVASFTGKKSILFIKAIVPFLKEKRNQALTFLLWEKYPPKSSQHKKIYEKLQELKKVYYGPT